LIVGIGVALGGWFVGHGFVSARMTDRYVTVKGISEREVKADLALWPIRLVTTDNDLVKAQDRMNDQVRRVREFLTKHKLDGTGAELQRIEVRDAYANQYSDASRVTNRYAIEQTLLVRSNDPDAVAAASQLAGELAAAGIAFSSQDEMGGAGGPRFVFTKLNELKPPMIEEATSRARESATKFAQDSRSKLGGIRQANQGVFEILPRDEVGVQEGGQLNKRVRVVSTVQYFLKD
jgi:hypothetical protein